MLRNTKIHLSVALCTYNGEVFLNEQLDSILKQTIVVDEIIICDDKSTDDTIKILNKYKVLHPNIFKIYHNEINLGSTKNFEKAISFCKGDYIFLSDQDDIWKSDRVLKTLSIFEKKSEAEGVFSNANLINNDGISIDTLTLWDSVPFFEDELSKPIDFFDVITKNGNVVTGATLCIKKSVTDFIFPFANDVLHDEWIATLLSLRNSLFYSTENLISYRIHDKQQVGITSFQKIQNRKRLKRIVLGLTNPVTFADYRYLLKSIYSKLAKTKKYRNQNFLKIKYHTLMQKNTIEFENINLKIKANFPIRHKVTQLIDALRGKRKL